MRHILCSLLLLLALPLTAQARMVDVERTTQGYGDSYLKAVTGALVEAVQQVRGVEVGTERTLQLDLQHTATLRSDLAVATLGVRHDIYSDSKGWVKSYEVLSVTPGKGDTPWAVRLKVTVPKFESFTGADDKRYTLAVMPFRISQSNYPAHGQQIRGVDASQRLQESLQRAFTQSQRFSVINRDYGAEFASEVALLRSDLVSATDASRLGAVAGADLMLVGRIHQVGDSPLARREFYGARVNDGMLRLEAAFQIIEVATQKIMWSDTLALDVRPDHRDFEIRELYERGSDAIVAATLGVIYPLRVLDIVSAEQIFLSQGGAAVKEGARLAVHGPGRALNDRETGRSLNVDGPVVAQVEVTTVQPQYSIAKLVEGELDSFSAESVLRPLDNRPESRPRRDTPGSSEAPLTW